MNPELEKLLTLSYSFAGIDRDLYYPNRERPENDAEHTFQLCLIAWHIIEMEKISLDQAKVFKLLLAHDLVEVYSGDVPLWGKTGHDEKAARELEALNMLKQNFPQQTDMTDVIAEYKERKTDEAKFACAIDKLAPFLNQLTTQGKVFKMRNVTLAQALGKLETQRLISPHLTKYFDAGIQLLKTQEEKFFDVK